MDDAVRRAMLKWPNVPSVYGWLALDRRGNWLIKNERITNPLVCEYIGRNYAEDPYGRWFFQNGPQCAFVTLAYTPLVYRLADFGDLVSHIGTAVQSILGAWVDEDATLLLMTEQGAGVLHDRDLNAFLLHFAGPAGESLADDALAEELEKLQQHGTAGLALRYRDTLIPVAAIHSEEIPARFGFVRRPEAAREEIACT